MAGLAALGYVAHVNLMAQAMHLSTPFSSALISARGPMFTLLLVRLPDGERFTHIQAAEVVLAMAGVLVFLSDKLALMRTQGLGELLLLSATVLFSAHTVAATRLLSRHGVIVAMAYSTPMAMAPMLLINAPQALLVPWTSLPATLWWALLWSLAVASFAGWLAWRWLNAYMGVPRTAPLLYLLPPVAGLVSWMALGESFNSPKLPAP